MNNSLKQAKFEVKQIIKKLNDNEDIIVRDIDIFNKKAHLIFIDEICSQEIIDLNIIKPLIFSKNQINTTLEIKDELSLIEKIKSCINFCNFETLTDLNEVLTKILRGYAVLVIDNVNIAIVFNVIKYEGRGVEEPPNSTVISGPREGFTENIKINLGLIRKRLVSNKLKIESLTLGERTKTSIKLVYFSDLANKEVVKKIKDKLNNIKIDGILDSYYVASMLESKPNSMFTQIGSCEKPDIACAKILEGRIAILVDDSPIVLTLPYVILEDFQSSNDYYSESHRATMLRILRLCALVVSIYLPGMYIALQLFHYKVLPLKFLITIINTTQNLPLNPFLEIFFIIILFDILFEASIRMPKYLGIAVSIVGALILGDTAVKAGLVSPPGVMIVALSAITIYILPNQSSQISILRFVFAFIGGTLGFHGIILGTMFLLAYLCNLDSYGSPYLAPYTPNISDDRKDGIIKEDIMFMSSRPKSFPNASDKAKFLKNKQQLVKKRNAKKGNDNE